MPATPCAPQERAEIIAQHWLQEGRVPTPRQVGLQSAVGKEGHGEVAFQHGCCANAGQPGESRMLARCCSELACLYHPTCQHACFAARPALLQVSEEERFVLPPHIEGEPGQLLPTALRPSAAACWCWCEEHSQPCCTWSCGKSRAAPTRPALLIYPHRH